MNEPCEGLRSSRETGFLVPRSGENRFYFIFM